MANTLDCEALSALFSQDPRIDVVEASADIEFGLARCQRLYPQVLLVDPKVALDIPERAAETVLSGHVRHVILLDDRLHERRLASVLSFISASYLTRQASSADIVSAIIRGGTQDECSFDPAFANRIRRTSRGWSLDRPRDRPSILALTDRELEVMKHLACGSSVRECAELLQLATSTIDNHKTRLMRKLQVHKAAELTQVAIREGIIVL